MVILRPLGKEVYLDEVYLYAGRQLARTGPANQFGGH
jgi:hypothetical protein